MATYTDYADDTTGNTLYAKPEPLTASPWSTGVVTGAENGTTGSYAFSLNSTLSYVVYRQAGGSPASSDLKLGRFDTKTLEDSLAAIEAQTDLIGTATILPLTGTVSAVANASHISIKTNEAVVVTVGLTNSSGTAVSTVGMTLELVFESGATEVVIANADITKSSTGFSFTVTTALNASEKLWTYVCRKTTDEAVLCNGKLEVIYAPNN